MNYQAEVNYISPLHVAARRGNASFLKTFISSWAVYSLIAFSIKDTELNSVYHYAAYSNAKTIEVINIAVPIY